MDNTKKWKNVHNEGGGMIYSLGVIGALIYTIQNVSGVSDLLWGVFQSLFWPAFLVYKAFEFFKF